MTENGPGPDAARRHEHDSRRGGHEHGSTGRLGLASAANVAFAVIQVVVGLAIGSVVVLADAAHQAVDALGLVTALIALRVARRPPDEQWTYGLGKSDALGGFVSALLLVASVVWIVWESIGRLFSPEEIDGWGVIVIGGIAILVNGVSVLLVGHAHDDHAEDGHDGDGHGGGDGVLSLRAARLHLLTDLAGSVIVVASGVLLAAGGPAWIDPAASLLLSVAVLWSTWRLVLSASQLLLDRVPGRVSTADVVDTLMAQRGVDDVHHVHLRPIGGGRVSVTAHVVVDGERSVHDAQSTVEHLGSVLEQRHRIGHSTLQLECHDCDDDVHPH